jgi:hypothetical protein
MVFLGFFGNFMGGVSEVLFLLYPIMCESLAIGSFSVVGNLGQCFPSTRRSNPMGRLSRLGDYPGTSLAKPMRCTVVRE